MFDTIKELFKNICDNGLSLPFAKDKASGQQSITVLFAYVSFLLACCSLVALHFKESLLTATTMSFVFSGMMTIFYMIRKLNKASVNLKDKSINLENNEKDNK